MSSPTSLFEMKNIIMEESSSVIETVHDGMNESTQSHDVKITVDVVSHDEKTKCNDNTQHVSCNETAQCNKQECCSTSRSSCAPWITVFVFIIAIVIIFILRFACNTHKEHDTHNGSYLTAILLLLAYVSFVVYAKSYGRARNIALIITFLILALLIIHSYANYIGNSQAAFMISVLTLLVSLVLLWYTYTTCSAVSAIVFIIVILLFVVMLHSVVCYCDDVIASEHKDTM